MGPLQFCLPNRIPASPRRWRRINTSTSKEDSTMPQIVEPTSARRTTRGHPTSTGRPGHRSRHRPARRTVGFPGLSDSSELGELTCNDGVSARSVRYAMVTCHSDRLSHHRETTGRRSTARTAITLCGREWNNRCYRRRWPMRRARNDLPRDANQPLMTRSKRNDELSGSQSSRSLPT